jgi:hypothetical protein
MARVWQLPASALPKLLQLMISSLHSKDLQIYFNSIITAYVHQINHIDSSIQSQVGDSLFIVDANIGAQKQTI